jgi:PAS domain S-box-containing protein
MGDRRKTNQELVAEVQELRRRLQEAEEARHHREEGSWPGEGSIQETGSERQDLLAELEAQPEELEVANEKLTVQAEELRSQNEELQALNVRLKVQKEELERITAELEAERALLRTVLEQMFGGVIVAAAPSGKFLWVNRQVSKILGRPVSPGDTLETHAHFKIIHPDGRTFQLSEYPLAQAISVGRRVTEEEVEIIRKDGTRRTLRVSAAPIRDRLGRIIAGAATYHDITERKRAEEAIRQTNDRLHALIQASPAAIMVLDAEGQISLWNPAAEEIFGWKTEEALGQKYQLLAVPEQHREEFRTLLAQVLQGQSLTGLEVPRQRKDGSPVYVSITTAPLHDAQGKVEGIVAVIQDITARKEAEEALRRAKEEWELTFNAVPDLIAILDDRHRIVRVNRAMGEALGTAPEDLVGRPCHQVMHNRAEPPSFCPHSQLLADGREHNAEVHELGRDFLVSASPLTDGRGNLMGSVHVARDITERRQAEEVLRRAHDELERRVKERTAELRLTVAQLQEEVTERQRAEETLAQHAARVQDLYDNAPCGYHSLDSEGTFIQINDTELAWLGYTRDEVVGRMKFSDLLKADGRKAFQESFPGFKERGRLQDMEYDLVRKDGTVFPVLLSATILKDEAGNYLMSRATVYDITARKRAEEALRAERQRLFAVLERIPAYVALISPDCRIPYANREFIRRFGDPGERLCYEFLFGLEAPCEGCKALEVFKTDTPAVWEWAGPDGNTYQIYDHPFTDVDSSPLVLELGVDITDRKVAENRIQRQSAMLEGINRIFRQGLTCETEEDLGRLAASVLEELTGARFGFVYELNPEGSLDPVAISEAGLAACQMAASGEVEPPRHLPVRGLYRSIVQEGKSLLANEPSSHPDSLGVPEGHPALTAFLGVPLKHGDAVMGIICLGNKPGGFNPADQEMAETLSVGIVEALMRFRAEKQAATISRLYRLLSKVNEAIVRAGDQEGLFAEVCRVAVEEGLFRMAWVGLVDEQTRNVRPVAKYGLEAGYLDHIQVTLGGNAKSRGPTGIAVREGRYDVCRDFATDPRMAPWREEALQRGYHSSAAFPLKLGPKVVGALTLYSGETDFFTAEEIGLLSSLAQDLSFAMESLDREARRRQAEEALKESEERLRYLAAQLIDAQEAERKRISMELHDDLGQSLTVLKLQLRGIDQNLPADFGELKERCADLRNNLDEVIEKVRGISRDLSPSILVDLGLPAALRHLSEEFGKYHEIKLSLKMDDVKNQFTPEEEINLYRIFQESLNNIAKHARASQIGIAIRKQKGRVSFSVADNGVGFDVQKTLSGEAPKKGLGLAAMDERVRMLGTALKISSQEGRGTRISFMVPMRWKDK